MSTTDWPALAPDIAAVLERGPLGGRRRREGREHGGQTVRYGARGSLRLTLTGPYAGTWADHETGAAGGLLALVEHLGTADSPADAVDWLRRHGVTPPESPTWAPNGATPARGAPGRQNRRPEHHGGPPGGPDRRARAVLAASEAIPPAPDHPARRWMAARHLWRADGDVPPWLRWLRADALAGVADTMPAGAGMVGAIVAPAAPLADWARAAAAPPYWPRETFSGCQLVNIDHDGRPAQDAGALGKRSYGRMAGSVTVAGLIEPRDGVTVCEGLADALSLAARYRPAAIATLGTAGLQAAPTVAALAELGAVAVAGLLGPSVGVCVYPDSDNAGLKAAAQLLRRAGAPGHGRPRGPAGGWPGPCRSGGPRWVARRGRRHRGRLPRNLRGGRAAGLGMRPARLREGPGPGQNVRRRSPARATHRARR